MKRISAFAFLTIFIILLTACNNVNKPVYNGGLESSFVQHSSEYNDLPNSSSYNSSLDNSLQSATGNSSNASSVPADHTHEFITATCTTAKACSLCGATEGEPAGHRWAAANCLYPKTCIICKATDNKLGEHIYDKGICTICGGIDSSIEYVVFNSTNWVANMIDNDILHQFKISYSKPDYYITYSKYATASNTADYNKKSTYSYNGVNYVKTNTSDKIAVDVEEVRNWIYITDNNDNRLVLERFTEDIVKITETGKKCFGYEKLLRVGIDFRAESAE